MVSTYIDLSMNLNNFCTGSISISISYSISISISNRNRAEWGQNLVNHEYDYRPNWTTRSSGNN